MVMLHSEGPCRRPVASHSAAVISGQPLVMDGQGKLNRSKIETPRMLGFALRNKNEAL
jgi:hypothetical protein